MMENWSRLILRVGKGKDLKCQNTTFTYVVVANLGPFSLWKLMLIQVKTHRISDEEKQFHVSQLYVCSFERASIRR